MNASTNDPIDNQSSDTGAFPQVDLPTELSADVDTTGAIEDETIQSVRWDFCLLFAGRAWMSLPVYAPSADEAASTIDAFVQRLNTTLKSKGYPSNICSWTTGACTSS
ncbi:MAG: hypothetical protein J2P37_30325 [Ktedonobacteraceae bacterium]|nr:hypothetical protein [Ktedonobacteraceae bacterium]